MSLCLTSRNGQHAHRRTSHSSSRWHFFHPYKVTSVRRKGAPYQQGSCRLGRQCHPPNGPGGIWAGKHLGGTFCYCYSAQCRQTSRSNCNAAFREGWEVAFLILSLASTRTKPNQGGLTGTQWAIYASFAVFMAYAEGFKGFQKKFSPLVVKRALTLDRSPSPGPVKLLLAGPYSMGLFHASRKRRIVSWAVTTSVFSLVQVVKRLPYPWRSIVDVGVVVGLSYGMLSIAAIWVKSLLGTAPEVDPAMPEPRKM
ncbi:unnamed protein product [Choristocarpus tenellus]